MKTHYELLGLPPTADHESIKKAFRREIARYHPDKVTHLGAEFQEMAASRAAELTVAYTTLTDPERRAAYDAGLTAAATVAPPAATHPRPAAEPHHAPSRDPEPEFRPPTIDEIKTPPMGTGKPRFEREQKASDQILRRAIGARVRATVEAMHGAVETPAVRGFDLALVPLAKPRFLGSPPPRVLVTMVDVADASALTEAWNAGARARVHAGKSPVVALVFGKRIAPQAELSKAWEALARQRKPPDAPDDLTVAVVDVADWSCRLPPNSPTAVQNLTAKICA